MSMISKGFSLIELLIAVSLITVLAGYAIPSFSRFSRRQILKQASTQVVSDTRTAQSSANSGVGGQVWGVTFTNNSPSYIIFRVDLDGTSNRVEGIKYFGGNVVTNNTSAGTYIFTVVPGKVYSVVGGDPISGGSVVMTDGTDTRTVTINAVGNVYEN